MQHHMLKTYIKYIKNPLVKEDAEKHKHIKGTEVFQKQEEAEAIRSRENRKMNQDSDKQEDQVHHRYVHGGMLQRNAQEEPNM
eukprot:9653466-Heterocapsa_arctica.AAC.1